MIDVDVDVVAQRWNARLYLTLLAVFASLHVLRRTEAGFRLLLGHNERSHRPLGGATCWHHSACSGQWLWPSGLGVSSEHGSIQFHSPQFATVYSALNECQHCWGGNCDGLASRPGDSTTVL